jgi:NTP pyrophosphatase (non-canonical NTP hydrolase)
VIYVSIALRDAQHLSWKTFRKLADITGPERGKEHAAFAMVTALLEEAGEVASAVRGLEGFKPSDEVKTKEMLATELSDILFMVFVLAEHYGIELEESFMQTTNDKFMSML